MRARNRDVFRIPCLEDVFLFEIHAEHPTHTQRVRELSKLLRTRNARDSDVNASFSNRASEHPSRHLKRRSSLAHVDHDRFDGIYARRFRRHGGARKDHTLLPVGKQSMSGPPFSLQDRLQNPPTLWTLEKPRWSPK
ncbi:hypothetical protein NL676_032514 [Syzygium grande]|nr:hypothetical protein NL676_032514 [Syzygium grande]